MNLKECLDIAMPTLKSLLGEDFNRTPLLTLHKRCKRRARLIIRELKPFSRKNTFPETYNPRAVHAMFALSFLYLSPYFFDFLRVVRLNLSPKTVNQDKSEFVVRVLETIKRYEYMSQFAGGTIRLYDEMSDNFKRNHLSRGMSGVVEDQLVVVIDFTNPVESIMNDLERLLKSAHNSIDDVARGLALKFGDSSGKGIDLFLPSKHAQPLTDVQGRKSKSPETYLPEWYGALMVSRLRDRGHKERSIVKMLYGDSKNSNGYETRKKTITLRAKLAGRLMEASFHGLPLTECHTRMPKP